MSRAYLADRWRRLPEGPALVDHEHDLLGGLDVRGFFVFREGHYKLEDLSGYDHHGSVIGSDTNVKIVSGPEGSCWSGDGNANANVTLDKTNFAGSFLKPTLPVTMIGRIAVNSVAAALGVFKNDHILNNYTGFWMAVGGITAAKLDLNYGGGAGAAASTNRQSKAGATSLVANTWYDVAGIIRGAADMTVILNGADDAGTTSGSGGAMAYLANASRFGLAVNGVTFNGLCDYFIVCAGDPTLDKIRAIQTEPYGLLLPSVSRRYFARKANAGGVSLTPDSSAIVVSLGSPILTQVHSLAPDDTDVVVALQNATLTQVHALTSAGLTVLVALGAPNLTQTHALTSSSLFAVVSLGQATITQNHVLTPSGPVVIVSLNEANLLADGTLSPNSITALVTLGAPALSQIHALSANSAAVIVALGEPGIAAHVAVTPAGAVVVVSLGSPSLTQIHALATDDLDTIVALGGAIISQNHVLSAAGLFAVVALGTPDITQSGGDITFVTGRNRIIVAQDGRTLIVRGDRRTIIV